MTLKKVIQWTIVLFLIFFVATDPTGAATIVTNIWNAIKELFHSITTFVTSLQPLPLVVTSEKLSRADRVLDSYLLPSERRRAPFVVHRHIVTLAMPAGLYLLSLVIAGLVSMSSPGSSLANLFWLITLGMFLFLVWRAIDWYAERLVVTEHRFLLITGLFTRKVAIMPTKKVTDLTYHRSIPGRMFGYGKFIVESAGQQQAFNVLNYIPRPHELYEFVSDVLFGGKPAGPPPSQAVPSVL